MNQSFEMRVRFQHCDPAGIVFYPRYFEMLEEVLEDWLSAQPQAADLAQSQQLALVQTSTRFVRPSTLGDRLRFMIEVKEVAAEHIELDCRVFGAGELRLQLKVQLGCFEVGPTIERVAVPPALRLALAA